MKREELCDAMNLLPDDIIHEAEVVRTRKKRRNKMWLKLVSAAACVCLAVVGAVYMMSPEEGSRTVLQWSDSFQAEDYFKYNLSYDDTSSIKSLADSIIPYAASRYFSDYRAQMEQSGAIPAMPNHPLYSCEVRYNEDGSIFSVTHAWHQQGDTYSDLTITIGYQEVEVIQDCICIEVDENGNIVEPAVTVTERDGIQIVAEGNEGRTKTITFQNDTAWYQITGSWGDGYAPMVALLDWVWEHPVDFEMFAMEKGVEITGIKLADCPEAFAEQIPDFETLGYFLGENYLQLKDGVPYTFEGHYYTGVTPEQVEDGSYFEMDGWAEIHWCIDTQPDYYDLKNCMGDISELEREQIIEALTENSNFSFLLDGVFIKVYCKDAVEAWKAVESIKR
ncbi:MAG: hypothetical protein HDR26_06710 [Lachnospiraceae bacterium]|nr:hypothetical protein [Lachnospiraceae bacterium]